MTLYVIMAYSVYWWTLEIEHIFTIIIMTAVDDI